MINKISRAYEQNILVCNYDQHNIPGLSTKYSSLQQLNISILRVKHSWFYLEDIVAASFIKFLFLIVCHVHREPVAPVDGSEG